MKALLIAVAALLGGAAWAQGGTPSDGAICRSFCDADARQCRKDAAEKIEDGRNGNLPMIIGQRVPSDSYDFTAEKRAQADQSDHRERATLSQRCSDQRLSCRRQCAPAAPAASAAR